MEHIKKWLKMELRLKAKLHFPDAKKQNRIFFTLSKKPKQKETNNKILKEKKKHLDTL